MDYTILSIAPIFLAPFTAFVINAFFGKKLPRQGDWVSVLGIGIAFLFAFRIFIDFYSTYSTEYYIHKYFTWFDLSYGENLFKIDLGIYIDNMGAIMLLMVTGVAFFIHLFSTWYMWGDVRYGKFFTLMSLFTSGMLGLVLSDNLLSMFIFWEIMGFCSYSLIGFYFEKEKAGYASIKAFMTTRVGDVFFLLGILAIWHTVGNVSLPDIYAAIANGSFEGHTVIGISLATFAGFCIFCGTIGKSAQFPLQVWLPDAMMGPTPCSALIHAATMVAAGVYLSLRMYPLMVAGGLTPFIAMIGGITAFGAATIALIQTDLKAVLAYSTISQLGYMVLGVGVGAYNAAFMHLITHAVFKACLFLSAGSVIHSVHTQEMPEMGGLRHKLKFTWIAMWCCTLAISGVPFFSGFVSKDRILGDALYVALHAGQGFTYMIPAALGFIGAFLTPFYMCRMMFLTFHGKPRDQHVYDHCHAEHLKINQNVPLLILSIFTLGVFFSGSLTGQGFVKIFGSKNEWFKVLVASPTESLDKFAYYTREELGWSDTNEKEKPEHSEYEHQSGFAGPNHENHEGLHHAHVEGAFGSIIIVACSIFFAFLMYIRRSIDPARFVNMFSVWVKALKNKYYFDHLYIDVIIQKGLLKFNNALAWFDMGIYDRFAIDGWEAVSRVGYKSSNWFDRIVVDKIGVDGTAVATNIFNIVLRLIQSGKIQTYFIVLIFMLVTFVAVLT
ncbi:MAG: NADH-quinone oxidoreductase subunit L [Halobacteriovoraceae bacterium]|nr:NADH-quinone oxidoreductase subunit L [Halobacteriovoraceae bacterium]